MAWGTTVPYHPAYQTWIPESPHIAAGRIRDDFCCTRRCEIDSRRSRSCNLVINPRVNRCVDDWEGPIDQYILLQFSISSVSISEFYFLSFTIVSRNVWIALQDRLLRHFLLNYNIQCC